MKYTDGKPFQPHGETWQIMAKLFKLSVNPYTAKHDYSRL